MSLTTPFALGALALLLPLVVAYLHRRTQQRRTVSSVILLRSIVAERSTSRRSWARPRHLWSLLCMAAALCALAGSLADPRRRDEEPRSFVVVLDTSASMGARGADGQGPTRLSEAVDALETLTERLSPRDRLALVTTGALTRVRVGLTGDLPRVLELARAEQPHGDSEGAAAALAIADAMCREPSRDILVLLSDGVGVAVPPTRCPVAQVAVGVEGDNVGVVGLSVREADSLGLTEVFLAVASTRRAPGTVDVELRVDDELADVIAVELPAEGDVQRLHRLALPEGKELVARVVRSGQASGDQLAADDEARAPRHAGRRVSALLVTTDPQSFTGEALRLHPRVDLQRVAPDVALPADARFDVVVLEEPYTHAALPAGVRRVALGLPPAVFGLGDAEEVREPSIIRWDFEHALFRFVDLSGLKLATAWELPRPEGAGPCVVDSADGCLGVLAEHEGAPLLYLGFAPQRSEMALRVAFVNLMANVVEWAAPQAEEPGERLVVAASESATRPVARVEGTGALVPGELPAPATPLWWFFVAAALCLGGVEALVPVVRGAWARRRGVRAASPSPAGRRVVRAPSPSASARAPRVPAARVSAPPPPSATA